MVCYGTRALPDDMASRVGRARHRLLLRIPLVPNPGHQSASQLKFKAGRDSDFPRVVASPARRSVSAYATTRLGRGRTRVVLKAAFAVT
jgi:hypothetical protein